MNSVSGNHGAFASSHPLISVERARYAAVAGVLPITGSETLPLKDLLGRVLDEAAYASHSLPPFDQSAVDGYAVKFSEISESLASLAIAGRQVAGQPAGTGPYPVNSTVQVFTGAVVPASFDAVVMQEWCSRKDEMVAINYLPSIGENIRRTGEDVASGSVLVKKGTLIDPRHIAIMAAGGIGSARVRRRINVGLISTGNELREPEESLQTGEIHDSNKSMLVALLNRPSIKLRDFGHVPDDPEHLAQAFADAATSVDVLVSTGGISVGEEDHVRAAITARGGYIDVLMAGMKPGKPAAIGRLGDTVLLALPGNPLAAFVTFLWFVRPVIEKRMGLTPFMPLALPARAAFTELRRPGYDEFIPVAVEREADGMLTVTKSGHGGSARLAPLLLADGLARIPAHAESIGMGDPLDVYLFNAAFALS